MADPAYHKRDLYREPATLSAFIRQHGITMSADWADSNPNMSDPMPGASHWRCTLRCRGRQMTVHFSQGAAICREPTVEDVLDCLASDASGVGSFEDWCSEYGYDTDSRKAERTYRLIERQSQQLYTLIGDADAYEALLRTERL